MLEIKKNKLVTMKKRKKHYKIVFLEKTKLDKIEILISVALIDSCIIHYKFVSVNNIQKKVEQNPESKTPKVAKTKIGKPILL